VVGVSTSTASITTRVRTWLFVAGLTALLIGAGALAGGAFLYAFVALAVLMNLAGYWFSDRIALAASRARPLPRRRRPGSTPQFASSRSGRASLRRGCT
jgi:hypothetical protein